jgi:predicted O-methyltransferase YrrM
LLLSSGVTYQTESEFRELLKRFHALTPRSRVLEIGSLGGETLWYWIQGVGMGGTVVSIDWRVPPSDARYSAHKHGQEVLWRQWAVGAGVSFTILNADSRAPQTVEDVRRTVRQLDFLFIDGGHDYATVMADYANYGPLVRRGGLIALHDVQGIADVTGAWNEIRAGKNSQEICHPDGWGIGVIEAAPAHELTILTPCSRPENLSTLLPGVAECQSTFNLRWIIVHDRPREPEEMPGWVEQHTIEAADSVAGKAQLNFAVGLIQSGWVWVLDDDNLVHPNFAVSLRDMLLAHPEAKAFVFPQQQREGTRFAAPQLMRECAVDQAQFVIRRDFIGAARYPLRYTGDGGFVAQLYAREPGAFRFGAVPAVYYNALRTS